MPEDKFHYENQCFRQGVKTLLEKKGMHQKEIAKAIGVTQQYISYILSGKRVGSPENRSKISNSLDCEYQEIVALGQAVIEKKSDIMDEINQNKELKKKDKLSKLEGNHLVEYSPIVDLFPNFGHYLKFAVACAKSEDGDQRRSVLDAFQEFIKHAETQI